MKAYLVFGTEEFWRNKPATIHGVYTTTELMMERVRHLIEDGCHYFSPEVLQSVEQGYTVDFGYCEAYEEKIMVKAVEMDKSILVVL